MNLERQKHTNELKSTNHNKSQTPPPYLKVWILHCSEISFLTLGIFNKAWTRLDK